MVDGGVDKDAAWKRKRSGWWTNQISNSDLLDSEDLKSTLYAKCHANSSYPNLDSPGVYMYINRDDEKRYIGSACKQSIFQRQQQHLNAASHSEQVGKFDRELSDNFNAAGWDFCALSMQGAGQQEILDKERELILMYNSHIDQYGYNTQLPGGR